MDIEEKNRMNDEWKDDFKLEGVTYRKLYDEFFNGMHQNLTTALWLTHVAEINTHVHEDLMSDNLKVETFNKKDDYIIEGMANIVDREK